MKAAAPYFENEHGEQWVFVRTRGSESGTLFGGDNGWEPAEVRERNHDEFLEDIARTGIRPGMVARIADIVDPLAPGVILNDAEKAWRHTSWQVSGALSTGNRDEMLAQLGQTLASRYATPEMKGHANSSSYRAAMQTFFLFVGREAGRRGLSDADLTVLIREALRALPAS